MLSRSKDHLVVRPSAGSSDFLSYNAHLHVQINTCIHSIGLHQVTTSRVQISSSIFEDNLPQRLQHYNTSADYCGTRIQHLEFEPGWASWVPSWQHRFPRNVLRNPITAEDGSKRPVYNASPLKTVSARQYPITIDDGCLMVHGFFINSLSTVSRPCVTLSIRSGIQVVNSWIPKNLAARYPTGETMLDAFLKIVVAEICLTPRRIYNVVVRRVWKLIKDACFVAGDFGREGEYVFRYVQCRCLAFSVKGYMALVSHQAKEGDRLCTLFGGSLLYVLRPKGDKFLLVGECYVHGLMDGEAIQFLEKGESVIKVISII